MINDIPVGRSVEEVLRLVKAFQFTDIHGEVCPEGWLPGHGSVSDHVTVIGGNVTVMCDHVTVMCVIDPVAQKLHVLTM